MDKLTKLLIVVCLVLFGAVSFMAGIMLNVEVDSQNNSFSYDGNTMKNPASSSNRSMDRVMPMPENWVDKSRCPYCGAPFSCSYDVPWYEKDGIMYEKEYREYECGHIIFMGTDYVRIYLWSEEDQQKIREDARRYRGRPPETI
ncbi:hypothetical protein DNK57_01405 [Methanothermobacter thermautotrophicus]|uniref:Uncharacterized protein n=1 Tax=Methanothermobacter thermautotrophicus TaxID=145262 RepID=A0A842YKW6_METTF|nr:hypothetical protein [Methanothermobacter thermautotrophicus]MBE2899488.1 hypothetical protein [Methanothermobacter thermautotrophicus]MCQ8905825.1 hypothetical protein [Methanothermobacter sp.]